MTHLLSSHYNKQWRVGNFNPGEAAMWTTASTEWNDRDRRGKTHLLQIEDVMVEIILQLLVCIVDAELLEAVGLKVLEAENVQDADGQALENKNQHQDDVHPKPGR